ncbi:MAG: FKBP-type peptidyl-prolyl cis-trans isomerase [Pseudomonadales bacterium]|nr:FKBP-type peptidyl-prolyl cis-trans isomerase [Pseudomonadales bacterium]
MHLPRYLSFIVLCVPLLAFAEPEQPSLAPEKAYTTNKDIGSDEALVSYFIGYRLGQKLTELDIDDLNYEALWKGLLEAGSEIPSRYSEQELSQAYSRYFQWKQLQKKQLEADNLDKAIQFLGLKSESEFITVTSSGLQYEVVREGIGSQVLASDWVRIKYHAKLADGTFIMDSSETPEGVWVPVSELIPAWTEALLLMPIGSRWTLYAGSKLTFGAEPPLKSIPVNAALVFDLELLKVRVTEPEDDEE